MMEIECEECGNILNVDDLVIRFVKCNKCGHRNRVNKVEEIIPRTIGHHFGMPVHETIYEK